MNATNSQMTQRKPDALDQAIDEITWFRKHLGQFHDMKPASKDSWEEVFDEDVACIRAEVEKLRAQLSETAPTHPDDGKTVSPGTATPQYAGVAAPVCVVVPREPTFAMRDAGGRKTYEFYTKGGQSWNQIAAATYRAMLAAAPAPLPAGRDTK